MKLMVLVEDAKIENEGIVSISNCSFSDNQVDGAEGGAISITKEGPNSSDIGPVVTISNSTFMGNTAQKAGAIYVEDGDLTLTDVTLTSNSSSYGGGGLRNQICNIIPNGCYF